MDHKLRVLIRIDIDQTSAVLVVHGCLTETNYQALLVLARRAQSLTVGLAVAVDLTGAKHVDAFAVDQLRHGIPADASQRHGYIDVMAPIVLPQCVAADAGSFSRMLVAA